MDKYQSPFKYPDEHMRLIGIIAAHFEALELILERAVARIMSHDPLHVALLTANINFNNKVDLVTAHVRDAFQTKTKDDVTWNEYTKVLADLKDSQTARNNFVHSKWETEKSPGILNRHKTRTLGGSVKITKEPISPRELSDAAQQIADAASALIGFLERNGVDLR